MQFNDKIIEEGLNQALVIAKHRAQILESLKEALLADDYQNIKFFASVLCGLTNESSRIPQSINTRTRG